jgi:hypothetical protein
MRSRATFVAMLTLTIGIPACGKYGAPVRSVPQQSASPSEATESQPQVPEERIPVPSDFDFEENEEMIP